MKTIQFEAGPDQVLENQDGVPPGHKRVKRKVAFLTNPVGQSISTVADPSNEEHFTAIKGRAPSEPSARVDSAQDAMQATTHLTGDTTPTQKGNDVPKKDRNPSDLTDAQKRTVGGMIVNAVKSIFGIADAAKAPLTISDALEARSAKKTGPITLDEALKDDKWFAEYWDLRWAFFDVLDALVFDKEVDGDRVALFNAAATDFQTRMASLIADRPAMKAVATDASFTAAFLTAAEGINRLTAIKAGKKMSSANKEKLMAAKEAIDALLEAVADAEADVDEDDAETDKGKEPATKPATTTKSGGEPANDPPEQGSNENAVVDGTEESKKMATTEALKTKFAALKAVLDDPNATADAKSKALADLGAAVTAPAATPAPAKVESTPAVDADAVAQKAVKLMEPMLLNVAEQLDARALKREQAQEERLASALKAVMGLDLAGNNDPEGKKIDAKIRAAETPESMAVDPDKKEKPPIGNAPFSLSGAPSVPPNSEEDFGMPTTKSKGDDSIEKRLADLEAVARKSKDEAEAARKRAEDLDKEVHALKTARPAGNAIPDYGALEPAPMNGSFDAGRTTGGWSGSLFSGAE